MIIPSAFSGIGRRMIASTIFNNNFPPSNAGIGNKLTIPKLIDKRAKKFKTPLIPNEVACDVPA